MLKKRFFNGIGIGITIWFILMYQMWKENDLSKKILFVVNVDWFFISHFLPVGLEGIKRDYEVHIACGITDKKRVSL